MIGQLMKKDILANHRSMLMVGIVFLGVTILMVRGVGVEKEMIALMFLCNLNFFTAMYWAHSLVSLEKIEGTLRWIRVLPVPDRDIILSKWLTMGELVSVFFSLSFSATVLDWVLLHPLSALLLWSSCILVGSAFLCGMWIFNARLGQTIPILAVVVVVFLIWKAEELGLAVLTRIVEVLSTDVGLVTVSALIFILSSGLAWITYWWFHGREGFQLVE